LTMEAYAANLPPGVMNFVSGSGKVTMGPIMRAGIDIFAFIGGSKTADILLKEHPAPHRLKVWLSLEGKNLGIVTADADIDNAVEQCALGSLTYNGQRCTAIKLIFLHESVSEQFITKFKARVATLKSGMPWTEGVLITPLPELKKPTYLTELLEDAVSKGAVIVNAAEGGGVKDGNLMTPAIVTGVTVDMRLWHEEQFGPVVPIAVYSDVSEVVSYINTTSYGQQAAIFSMKEETVAPLMDILSTAVGRININTQCARSPDVFPFSGRRSSALGTLSITEALIAFSTETVVAGKANDINDAIMKNCIGISNFLAPVMTPR
jgi:glyceraldehyde-3-phosphate dehydrogenase (NADP+)